MAIANGAPRDTRQAEYPVTYSIDPILTTLSILQDRDLSSLSYSIYRQGGVSYGGDTSRAEYEMVLSNWKPNDSHQAEYPIGGIRSLEYPYDTPPLGGYPIGWIPAGF